MAFAVTCTSLSMVEYSTQLFELRKASDRYPAIIRPCLADTILSDSPHSVRPMTHAPDHHPGVLIRNFVLQVFDLKFRF